MRSVSIALISLLLLLGCRSERQFQQAAESWIGRSEGELIQSLGVPDRSHKYGASTYLEYHYGSSVEMPGLPPAYTATVIGDSIYVDSIPGSPAYTVSEHCALTFQMRAGKVYDYSYRGNGCRA